VAYHTVMIEHINLLAMALAIGAGLVTLTVSALRAGIRRVPFYRAFLTSMLLFNLLVLAGLVLRYLLMVRRYHQLWVPLPVLLGLLLLLALVKLGWLSSFCRLTLALTSTPDDSFRKPFLVLGGTVVALYAVSLVLFGEFGWPDPGFVTIVLELLVIAVVLTFVALMLVRASRSPAGPSRSSLVVFGVVHLVVFCVGTGLVLVGWMRTQSGTTPPQVLYNSLLLIFYNIFLLWWILRFRQSRSPSGLQSDIFSGYGITPREQEIIVLICAGKTNQEIADQLFVSLATVKDHNHNIFRKTAVRNRVELANLFQR